MLAWPEIMTTGTERAQRLEIFEKRKAVFAGHDHVGEHHIEALRLDQFERARGVVAHRGLVSGEPESAREGCQSVGVVIDYEQVGQLLI